MRIGALPTRSRTTRGRSGDRLCRAGCMAPETSNHVLQICSRARKARINRYDAVLSYLGRNLRRQDFEVQEETNYRSQEGLRKPDIVATLGTLGLVIDAQIVGEQSDLERARTVKIRKYADNPDIERASVRLEQPTSVIYRSSSPGGVSGHHHPERFRCHRHPCAHRWYHRPPQLESLNRGHVRMMTSPKEDHHPILSVLPAVLRHKLLHLVM